MSEPPHVWEPGAAADEAGDALLEGVTSEQTAHAQDVSQAEGADFEESEDSEE